MAVVLDGPKYQRLHRQVRTRRGPASEYPCVECDNPADGWANISGYHMSVMDYQPMCAAHHKQMDTHRNKDHAADVRMYGGKPMCRTCKNRAWKKMYYRKKNKQ